MTAALGIVVIGTEILRGKRQDAHFARTRRQLAARGYEVAWCLLVPDMADILVDQLRWAMARAEPMFSFGGLGATPDDLTRACAATAAGLPLRRHSEAERLIRAQFGAAAEPVRIRMADLPEGATLIPNPINKIPGFSLGKQHFFPGFPQMAEPMSEWVLAQYYPPRAGNVEQRILLPDAREGELVPLMESFCAAHPRIAFSSLPSLRQHGMQLELGVAGLPADVERAMADLQQRLRAEGLSIVPLGAASAAEKAPESH